MQNIMINRRVMEVLRPKKKAFSIEEDAVIVSLINRIGANWRDIAKSLPGRTERQCRERYKTYLDPNLRHDPWSPEEDDLLIRLYNEIGPRWAEMSKYFNGRSDNSIKNRYNTHIIHRPRNSNSQRKTQPSENKQQVQYYTPVIANTTTIPEVPFTPSISIEKQIDVKLKPFNGKLPFQLDGELNMENGPDDFNINFADIVF